MTSSPVKVSVVICTLNRSSVLYECLMSLASQTVTSQKFRIVVVDNGSYDQTVDTIRRFKEEFKGLEYLYEPRIGLSHARNRGWKEASTEWIGYIDDDSRVPKDFIKRTLWIIENYPFDCFGGTYDAWYKFGKPKWLPENFGNKIVLQNEIGELKGDYLSGGNFFVKRKVLEEIGGFDPNLGMKEEMVRYGEEDLLQDEMRKLGYIIGFDPQLKIEHAVMPHKLKVSWHLKSYYASARDQQKVKPISLHYILLFIRSFIASIVIKLPFSSYRLLFHNDYYPQNFLLDVINPLFYRVGQIVGWVYHFKKRLG